MVRFLLFPFSLLYGVGVYIRNKMYDWGLIRSREYDIPIVCIGNIAVGGTGKTPMAEFLVEHFSQRYRVALLSRGYMRRTKGYLEAKTNTPYRDVGDEPKQIKLKYPEIVVAVCEKREVGIDRIRAEHPEVEMIILDDALQYRKVEAWTNVVMMDYAHPFYNDHFLPWGRLRDSKSQLHRAHFLIVTKCPQDITPLSMRIVNKSLGLYPYQKLYFTYIVSGAPTPLFPDAAPERVCEGGRVIAMSGIANPEPFITSLRGSYDVTDTLTFPDHHAYRVRDLDRLARMLENAPQGTAVVITEKDAVKLTNRRMIPEIIQQNLYYVPIKMVFQDQSGKNFLHRIENHVRSNPKYELLH